MNRVARRKIGEDESITMARQSARKKAIVGFIRRSHHKNEGWHLMCCPDFDATDFHVTEPHGLVKESDLTD
jgi:hypothetical protein